MKITPIAIAIALLAASSANAASPANPTAQTIYLGGDIVTVNDAAPTVQALAVKNGRILALGSERDILTLRDEGTWVVDLQGKTLIPGFIDAHGHVDPGALSQAVNSIAALQQSLRNWVAKPQNREHGILASLVIKDERLLMRLRR
jgi:predicted amidohydrolase YtcJ